MTVFNLFWVVKIILIFLGIKFIYFYVTSKKFIGLKHDDYIILSNKKVKVKEIVEHYKPCLYIDKRYSSSLLKNSCLEMIAAYALLDIENNKIVIYYHLFWNDEYNPNSLIDKIYRFIRRLYYGGKCDVEYIQFTVCKKTGKIEKVVFETPPNFSILKYYVNSPIILHYQTELLFKNNIIHLSEQSFFNKNRKYKKIAFFRLPLAFQIVTWNHLISYVPNPDNDRNLIAIDAPFVYLNDNLIRNYKLAQRSNGRIYLKLK